MRCQHELQSNPWVWSKSKSRGSRASSRRLRLESLEHRQLLAITVDTVVDELDGSVLDGDVSLRDAIAAASNGETIDFAPALAGETIPLTLGELRLSKPVAIDASMLANGLTIDASGNSRVFEIDNNDDDVANVVTLRGLTLTGGGGVENGGAIHSRENLTLIESTISGNQATHGGGIDVESGTARIVRSTLSANSADVGGGIYVGGSLHITDSTVSGNTGGGIYGQSAAEIEIVRSTITNNHAEPDSEAGGVSSSGTVRLSNTIVAGNLGGVHSPGH